MCRIRDDGEKSEVCQACVAVIIDQDVRLDKKLVRRRVTTSVRRRTPFKFPCVIT